MPAVARIAPRSALVLLAALAAGCQGRQAASVSPADRVGSPAAGAGDDETGSGAVVVEQPPATAPAAAASLPFASAPATGVSALPTGRPCRMHLRRDALGLTGVAPLSIQNLSPAARAAWLEGTVEQATDQWVVLRSPTGRTYWVRADVILAVEFIEGK